MGRLLSEHDVHLKAVVGVIILLRIAAAAWPRCPTKPPFLSSSHYLCLRATFCPRRLGTEPRGQHDQRPHAVVRSLDSIAWLIANDGDLTLQLAHRTRQTSGEHEVNLLIKAKQLVGEVGSGGCASPYGLVQPSSIDFRAVEVMGWINVGLELVPRGCV
jgi:hypothetical protein